MNQSIVDFAEERNMRFVPVKITFDETNLDEEGNPSKNKFYPPQGWNKVPQFSAEKCRSFLEKNLNPMNNHILINLTSPDVIVVDCDKKEAYNRFVELIKEKNVYSENAITKSTRGDKFNIPYKRHFYFNVNEEDYDNFKRRFKGKYLGKGFDTFYNDKGVQVIELKNTTLGNIPTISFEDYEYIFDTMKSEYRGTTTQLSFEKEQPEKKKKLKRVDNIDKKAKVIHTEETLEDVEITENEIIEKLLDGIDKEHWNNYNDWKIISYIFINENLPPSLFHKYSKLKCPEKYNEEENQKCLEQNKEYYEEGKGYKLKTLWFWLKEENLELFTELQCIKNKFWNMLQSFNQDDIAKYYYSVEPNKYLRSESSKEWYEYNEYNILKPRGSKPPSSMINNISSTIKTAIEQQYKTLKPTIIKDQNGNIIPDKEYERKKKLLETCYRTIGSSSFVKGSIDFLQNMYTIENVEELTDVNMTLLAFDNGCYDIKLGEFRNIKPKDYITKTVGYNYPKSSNLSIRQDLLDKIGSIYENDEMLEYILKIKGLSLFSDKLQSIFIHTGSGGNGKSMMSILNKKALGQYAYQADSSFLTTVIQGGRADPTLANCRGRRLLAVSEPDDGSGTSKLNAEMIKKLSGGEDLTARDLHKSNITFKPTFTADLYCNNIPKLSKLDNGIARRLKVINYPFSFVDNPKNENEKQRDYTVQDKFESQEYINEYILVLLDKAKKHYKDDISKMKTPNSVSEEINDYLESNNPIKMWLSNCVIQNSKGNVKASDAYKHYLNSEYCEVKLSLTAFGDAMKFNKFNKKKTSGVIKYIGIEIKQEPEDEGCGFEKEL